MMHYAYVVIIILIAIFILKVWNISNVHIL